MRLQWRPYQWTLKRPLQSARGLWRERCGWLLRLEATGGGAVGWGEAAPLPPQHNACAEAISALPAELSHEALNTAMAELPKPVAFALGLALCELEAVHGQHWLPAPASAVLLPAGPEAIAALTEAQQQLPAARSPLVAKWKVGALADEQELEVLETLLAQLSAGDQLRLDANGGWDRATAGRWAMRLQHEAKLQWLEQPLAPQDHAGLLALARRLPVALDESLRDCAGIPAEWSGWLVHKPALEGDPRALLRQLRCGAPKRMVSSALESGIGARAVAHLAALAWSGPTPCPAGLAPGWGPSGALGSLDPQTVWEAAEP